MGLMKTTWALIVYGIISVTFMGSIIIIWAWLMGHSEVGLWDQYELGLRDQYNIGLWDQYEIGLWDQHEIGLWDQHEIGWWDQYIGLWDQHEIGFWDQYELGLCDHYEIGLWNQYETIGKNILGSIRASNYGINMKLVYENSMILAYYGINIITL